MNRVGFALGNFQLRVPRTRGDEPGITGFGSACVMMGMRYGDDESKDFLDRILSDMVNHGWDAGFGLADEKGTAPILSEKADRVKFCQSRYFDNTLDHDLLDAILRKGSRFTHHTSIAPTGTISLSLGNNCSSGIEPSFAHEYTRNIIKPGKKAKESVPVYSYEALAYRQTMGRVPLPDERFYSASDVSPRDHIDIQATAQRWVDSSISKTINVPTDYQFDDFKELYRYAWEKGCKGCTTFRFNPDVTQGVLIKQDDLKSTVYTFTLSDGSTVQARGDEMIEYNGESQTAANLHDAIKDGYYGRL
ncbi:MAG: hypothetical protein HQL58_09595 [Magnetococcales bacterium]|nr:hypothetical protein [Magnetococcales bacterium]